MVDLAAEDYGLTVGWTSPGALWLLAVIPILWIALRFARANFSPRQRVVQTITRGLLLALLVLALARPVVSGGSSQLSVVYLVDVSHSIAAPGIIAAAKQIDDLNARMAPAHSRIAVFGRDAAVVETTQALRQLAGEKDLGGHFPGAAGNDLRGLYTVDRTGTDLEAALLFARASLAPGFLPRIVLFSDGRQTAGDLTDAVARLHADGVQVSVVPLGQPALGDTWIDGIDVPDRLSAGATFAVVLHVTSQRAGRASVDVRAGGRVLASRPVSLVAGVSDISLDVQLVDVGAQTIEGVVTMADDPVKSNDRLARAVLVAPQPRVLYLEGGPGESAKYLAGALTAAGVDVAIRAASAWQRGIEPLEPWDVVILSDVPRAVLPDAAMRSLAAWVETQGGGLLVAGGEAVFGEGPQGYRKTELERLTPVTFERRDEPEVALVIVLDKSYSMNGPVMELCKGAAQAAIDALSDEQSVGVITFNDKFGWDVTLRNVGKNRDEIRKAVSAIEASGSTMIYPPLEQAFLALKNVKARACRAAVRRAVLSG
jgi:Mg-chelatase subunit ChlD